VVGHNLDRDTSSPVLMQSMGPACRRRTLWQGRGSRVVHDRLIERGMQKTDRSSTVFLALKGKKANDVRSVVDGPQTLHKSCDCFFPLFWKGYSWETVQPKDSDYARAQDGSPLRYRRQGFAVLLLMLVFGFHFSVAVFEYVTETGNNLLEFTLRECGADPDDQASDPGHE
jgi:hypothetical protein